ncbi:SURF1 family cytochrome oxidase biogenesis protein [Saccharomonospora sp. NPDC046836]|uniref:SURF1 family cytochrome oxidase biogenesis protein n=1 Tax=Saccharomonospora sp. NPDC046836 TaxID=3156921 RepID=UPI0033D74725
MRWKLLFRPSWLALTLVVFVFAIACYTLLAPWQFNRNDERANQNAALTASFSANPKPLDQVGAADSEWERVLIRGTYLTDAEVIARLRTVQGEPAFEVLTPLRTTSGQVVLIDRGYVRPDSRTQVPPYAAPPSGVVQIEARMRNDEPNAQGREAFADASTGGRLHAYSVNSQVVGNATGLDIRPGYFQLEDSQPGVLAPLPLPQLQAGPFFSYALQWIAFGTMALLGWLYFTIRELKPGGALAEKSDEQPPARERRKSVAQILAEDEERERAHTR